MLSFYLSTKHLRKYFQWLNIVLVVVAMLIGVDIVRAAVKHQSIRLPEYQTRLPSPTAQAAGGQVEAAQPYEYYSIIVERNLFGSEREESEQKVDIESLPQTTLKLALKGTIIGGILYPQVIIEDLNTKREEVYRLGDVIEGVKIVEIQRDRVVFKKGGETLVLLAYESGFSALTPSSPSFGRIVKTGENRWRIYKSDLLGAAEDRLHLLAQVRISSYLEKGRMAGFRISDIDEVSVINQIGIKDGDVIEKINKERIDSIAKAWEVYERVKDKPLITVDVKRDDKMVNLNYEILD